MQGVWATCFTFNLVTWVLLCLVCLCSCWVVGVVVCFKYPGFLQGIAIGQLGLLLSLDHSV